MTDDRTTSVVICAYTEDRFEDLSKAVASVQGQALPTTEIILVIDHNEPLRARAVTAFPGVKVVANSGRQGLSDARNTGVAASLGSIIAFLDDDARAAPDWLATLVEAYRDPEVMGAGGFAEPSWEARRPGWFPEEFDWVVGCSYRGMPTAASAVRNVLGCNMSFRREAFGAAGGFSTQVGRVGTRPVGGEETEFCIRLASRMPDARIVYLPSARVLHRVPAARGTWSYFRTRCIMEGVSKATVADLSGGGRALSTERHYVLVTLPGAVVRGLLATLTLRDAAGIGRAGAVIAGLLLTMAGYLSGRASLRKRRARPRAVQPPA